MLRADGPQAGQHGDGRAVSRKAGVDSVLRADPLALPAHTAVLPVGSGEVKRVRSRGQRRCLDVMVIGPGRYDSSDGAPRGHRPVRSHRLRPGAPRARPAARSGTARSCLDQRLPSVCRPWRSHRSEDAWIAWWSLGTVAIRVLIVWLYNNTGRSVFAASLFHATTNVSTITFASYYDPRITGSILALVAAIVAVAWGPHRLARYRNATL